MVDFLDLATSSRWLIERALSQQDDDFAQLDVSSSSAASPTLPDDGYSYGATETRPVLSKSAEAELYLLATNFLLCKEAKYQPPLNPIPSTRESQPSFFCLLHSSLPSFLHTDVAMVIITTMVAKIYFPESLERGQEPATLKRNYDYRRKRKDSASDFGSISDEEARFLNSNSDDEELYSDEDDDYDEEEGDEDNSEGEEAYLDDSPKVLEFDQVHTSRTQVIQRLLFCSLMLNSKLGFFGNFDYLVCSGSPHSRMFVCSYLCLLGCFAGENADEKISSTYWRLLYLFVCIGVYQSFLDARYVGNVAFVFETSHVKIHCTVRVLLPIYFKHVE